VRVRSLALLASAVLVFAACGSDDAKKAPEESTTTPTTLDEHGAEHADSGDHGEHSEETMDHSEETMDHGEAARPAKPLPVLPNGILDPEGVDLSGIAGVSAEQQAFAEALLVDSIETLPKWTDYDQAVKDGFLSIGDEATGEEHVIHWDWIDDDNWLDPAEPESLVYKVENNADGTTTKTLEAAMFLLPKQFNLDNAPTDGGALMQYHMHDDLCFTDFPQPLVRGLRAHGGTCEPPLIAFDPNIMVHAWIRPNECGPFAALQGIGGGQIKDGEDVSCLMDHGSAEL
jgi:hypothetical protein